jgi:glycosyltransferase involved in cell wall biosynthesis
MPPIHEPLIAYDARQVRPGMTGVGRRAGHLLRAAIRRSPDLRWGVFTNTPDFLLTWLEGNPPSPLPPSVSTWPVDVTPEAHPRNEWWLNVTLPGLIEDHGAALFDAPAFAGPWRRLPIPVVLTVHDMVHRQRPRTQPQGFRLWLDRSVALSARVADRIIVPSAAVARDLAAAHTAVHGRVVMIPGGVSPEMRPWPPERVEAFREELGMPRRYLLHVGTFEPRKNHRALIEIHGALCAEIDDPPTLVMVGAPGPTLHEVERWVEQSPWRALIHIRTGVDDAELEGLLNGASALVFPSLSEGFGLPVIEALACGVPVLASNAPGLDFFSDSPARLLPAGSIQPWVAALRRILSDPALRAELRVSGPEYAMLYTWNHAADLLIALYRELLRT